MKTIRINRAHEEPVFILVDDADYAWASAFGWCLKKSRSTGLYAARFVRAEGKKLTVYMHRELLGVGAGVVVDHRDGNGLNNCRSNLRICSLTENSRNRRKSRNATGKYKGVYPTPDGKWRSRIRLPNGPMTSLGTFASEEAAARAYDAAARKLHGAFAQLNFDSEGK